MALPAIIYQFELDISDVDRGVYVQESLRVAQHPSETAGYLLSRVLAWALEYDRDNQFGRGVSTPDEPALSRQNDTGGIKLWIEIGAPSADRMHKITKQADEVKIYSHRELRTVTQELQSRRVHRLEEIEIVALPIPLLTELEAHLDRRSKWSILRSEGSLYVTIGDETLSGPIASHWLTP